MRRWPYFQKDALVAAFGPNDYITLYFIAAYYGWRCGLPTEEMLASVVVANPNGEMMAWRGVSESDE